MSFIQWRQYGDVFEPEEKVILHEHIEPGQYTITQLGQGRPLALQRINPITDDLVRIKDTVSDQVLVEIDEFLGLRDRYKQHGAVHKRGFLLYGPQGTGKTCTLRQIAEQAVDRFGAIVIDHTMPHAFAQVMSSTRQIEETRPIVCMMEDVDNIAAHAEEQLLELLDGKNAIDGVVFVGTTNYMSSLSPRIRNRPSRFDRIIRIGAPSAEHRLAYLESRHTTLSDDEKVKWVLDTDGFSLAHLKELVLSVQVLGVKYREALDRISGMARDAQEEAEREESDAFREKKQKKKSPGDLKRLLGNLKQETARVLGRDRRSSPEVHLVKKSMVMTEPDGEAPAGIAGL